MNPQRIRIVLLVLGLAATGAAGAQSVALSGTMGDRALIVIDGAPPFVMAPGDVRQGIRLVSAAGDAAVVEIQGRRQSLRIGASPVRIDSGAAPAGAARGAGAGADAAAASGSGSGSSATRIVLNAGSGGHYFGTGRINGATVRFLVDTGASTVALSASQAAQIGIDFRAGERVAMSTANGVVPAYRVRLDSVRLGEVEVYGVEATVVASEMPFVLLGNSFLSRFRIRQENDVMMLERRY